MKSFKVIWEVEVGADTAEEAAQEALKMQRDSQSQALNFEVINNNGLKVDIDLLTLPYEKFHKELQLKLEEFDSRIALDSDFSDQALEDSLSVSEAVESYFCHNEFDIDSLTPLKCLAKEFMSNEEGLERPYAKIAEYQLNKLLAAEPDFYLTNAGFVVTFGTSDVGFAMQRINEETEHKVLNNQSEV